MSRNEIGFSEPLPVRGGCHAWISFDLASPQRREVVLDDERGFVAGFDYSGGPSAEAWILDLSAEAATASPVPTLHLLFRIQQSSDVISLTTCLQARAHRQGRRVPIQPRKEPHLPVDVRLTLAN